LKDKNILEFGGKPLIFYTIEAAKRSTKINRIVLSTDDPLIAKIGKLYGAEVPFMRPSYLATDNSPVLDTLIYTVEKLNLEENTNISDFIVLQPTSPLRTSNDIDQAIDLFYAKKADSIISFCKSHRPIIWAKKIHNDGHFSDYIENKNPNETDDAFFPNGAIYIIKYSFLKKRKTTFSEKSYPYIMPPERSFDIDTDFDFLQAELYLKYLEQCKLEKS
jgi:N-acylneuraminate cytidylyltransferase/CMP-N,N'-diacetyllegionaminic acid synthase